MDARRCWVIACVCLLVVAAGLRFYNLSGHTLRHDEVLASVFARGSISEVVANVRAGHSAPILHPLALWAVQKASITEFSLRVLPAAASLLTVGALLFWMPRLGVARWAAFLAGLLAALSVGAIENASDVREYSLDALVAVLMIGGTLQYLRDGRRGLLCGALFVAPLLQYGLVLLGAAALCVAAVGGARSSRTGACDARRRPGGMVWEWLRRRIGLLLPIACFGAACAVSWGLTARYQWDGSGYAGHHHLAGYYYQGGFEYQGDFWAASMAEFAVSRAWGMLGYHMPTVIAVMALAAFGWQLLLSARRRRLDAIALLAVFGGGGRYWGR